MGNVAEPYNFDREMQKSFMKCNILTKQKCIDCFAKYYCSGGCAANANKYNGSIYIPHEMTCELLKKRIECAMGIYAKREQRVIWFVLSFVTRIYKTLIK